MAGGEPPPLETHSRRSSNNNNNNNNVVHPVSVSVTVSDPPQAQPVQYQYYREEEVKHHKKWFPWLIPFFVVANVVVFVVTMYVNNCPHNSVSCIARFLGRFSFQPFKENPLLGPSSLTYVSFFFSFYYLLFLLVLLTLNESPKLSLKL